MRWRERTQRRQLQAENMMHDNGPERLEKLWTAYRQATPEPEPSVNFMPELWAKIEAARPSSWTLVFARLASRLVPVAAAVTLAMSVYIWSPTSSSTGYVDTLAAELMQELASTEGSI